MDIKTLSSALLVSSALLMVSSSFAEDTPFKKEIKARQSFMQIYAYNLGLLGAMAKGQSDYNAQIASGAANNLLAAAQMDNSTMWPKGSDAGVEGLDGKTRAKVDIWTTYPKIGEKGKALMDALTVMAADAGNGLDAVKANMGKVGKGCKGCHEDFRVPKN